MKPMKLKVCVTVILANVLAFNANAQSLVDVLHMAEKNDYQWMAVKHGYQSNKELLNKAAAGIKPTLTLNAEVSQETLSSNDYGNDDYDSHRYSATLVQPVFRLERWHAYKKSRALDRQVDADFKSAQQAFYMRVVGIYFDVLRAEENVKFRLAEKSAIEQQLIQTEQRFKADLIASTDVEEARAAFDISSVQHILALQDKDIALENLSTLVGLEITMLSGLAMDAPVDRPADLQGWIDRALKNSPQLISSSYIKNAAEEEFKSRRAAHYPTLDLVGAYQNSDRYIQTSEGGLKSSSLSLKLAVPLYAGGGVSASRRQSQQLYLQSRNEFEYKKRETLQNASNIYRIVNTDVSRVLAQKQSIRSLKSALNATQAGYKAGTRTIVDVLTAQQALYGVQRDYANARFDYVLDLLKLKQVAGSLEERDILEVNGWLES